MMTITILLAFVCTTTDRSSCEVWQEGSWTGPAASVYCTAERDYAEALAVREEDTQYTYFECHDFSKAQYTSH